MPKKSKILSGLGGYSLMKQKMLLMVGADAPAVFKKPNYELALQLIWTENYADSAKEHPSIFSFETVRQNLFASIEADKASFLIPFGQLLQDLKSAIREPRFPTHLKILRTHDDLCLDLLRAPTGDELFFAYSAKEKAKAFDDFLGMKDSEKGLSDLSEFRSKARDLHLPTTPNRLKTRYRTAFEKLVRDKKRQPTLAEFYTITSKIAQTDEFSLGAQNLDKFIDFLAEPVRVFAWPFQRWDDFDKFESAYRDAKATPDTMKLIESIRFLDLVLAGLCFGGLNTSAVEATHHTRRKFNEYLDYFSKHPSFTDFWFISDAEQRRRNFSEAGLGAKGIQSIERLYLCWEKVKPKTPGLKTVRDLASYDRRIGFLFKKTSNWWSTLWAQTFYDNFIKHPYTLKWRGPIA